MAKTREEIIKLVYGNQPYQVADEYDILQGELAQAREELAKVNTPCVWKYDAYDCFYESACGKSWFFETGTAEENDVHYCHNCGHPVQVVMPPEPTKED